MFLVMDEATAQELRDSTEGLEHRLDPRLIEGGDYAGSYGLNENVTEDPQFAFLRDQLDALDAVILDTNEAFPNEV